MKRNNLWFAAVLLFVIVAFGLTACKNSGTLKEKDEKRDLGFENGEPEAEPGEALDDQPDSQEEEPEAETGELVTILVAAAASLEYSLEDELIPIFEQQNPGIAVEGSYDSSGKLKTQIEEGLDADVFISAAVKQMDALKEENLIDQDSVVDLLENKIVLITGTDNLSGLQFFEDIVKADTIAVGDPESVPAGQYAKEALTSLGLWEEVNAKASLGSSVTEVLNWVSEGSADAGVVYATDAAANEKTEVVAEAPKDALGEPVIYPAGIVAASSKKEAARLFVEFLQSEEAGKVFEKYGFVPM